LLTTDGIALRAMRAGPATGRGTVLVLNGRGEFMERYFEIMTALVAQGFCVASLDWRGQGGSERLLDDPLRGHVRSYAGYDEDLRTAMEQLVHNRCPGPYFVIAHSTGGNILLRNVLDHGWFSKAIITAPLMELHYGAWPKWLSRLLARIMVSARFDWVTLPGLRTAPFLFSPFDGNPLTGDQSRWERDRETLELAPVLGVGAPTFGWLKATMDSIAGLTAKRFRRGPKCPVLMVLAGRERVVDNAAALAFAADVPGISVITLQDSLHEIMNEREILRQSFLSGAVSYFEG
jgi:lysophospholipase